LIYSSTTIDTIDSMTNLGRENEEREFKESTTEVEKGIISLTAMLNKQCFGEVFFGVKDNGDVIGQDIGKNTFKSITQVISNHVEPALVAEITELTSDDGKKYISVKATNKGRPFLFKGIAYIRTGEEDRKAPLSELKKMIMSSGDPLEDTYSRNQSLTFTEFCNELRNHGRTVQDDQTLYNSFGLLNIHGQFNLLGELLSDQNPQQLTVVVFGGMDRTRITSRKDYSGKSLVSEVKDVLEYVGILNETRVDMSKPVRRDKPLFDYESFREAWINACVHNNWLSGIPPAVHVFDDRMEVISYGGLPYWLSLEEFYSGRSMPVNEPLMRAFISTGLSEHTGHGVPVVVNSYGTDAYSISDGVVRVTLGFSSRRLASNFRLEKDEPLTEREILILTAMREFPNYTLDDISDFTGLSRSSIGKTVPKLRSRGLVERTGSKRNGGWIVHYDG